MPLDNLAKAEENILAAIHSSSGKIEEKLEQFTHEELFDRYIRIHGDYTELASNGDLEALKRAFFIQWYASIEPPFLTGIPSEMPGLGTSSGLSDEHQKKVLQLLEESLESIDQELQWMLAHAYCIVDWYFDYWDGLHHLKKYLKGVNTSIHWSASARKADFINRGQMGYYYASIAKN